MEVLPIFVGIALMAVVAYSLWRWLYVGDKNTGDVPNDVVENDVVDTDLGHVQPLDGGPLPRKPK